MASSTGSVGEDVDPELLLMQRSRGVWLVAYSSTGIVAGILAFIASLYSPMLVIDPIVIPIIIGLALHRFMRPPILAVRRLNPRIPLVASMIAFGAYAGSLLRPYSFTSVQPVLVEAAIGLTVAIVLGLVFKLAMSYTLASSVGSSLSSSGGIVVFAVSSARYEAIAPGMLVIGIIGPLASTLALLLGLPAHSLSPLAGPAAAIAVGLGAFLGLAASRGLDPYGVIGFCLALGGLALGYLASPIPVRLVLGLGELAAGYSLCIATLYSGFRALSRGIRRACIQAVIVSVTSIAAYIIATSWLHT